MIPYKDDNPTVATPVVTIGIIALNLAAWLLVQGAGAEPGLSRSVCQFGLIPGNLLQQIAQPVSIQLSRDSVCQVTGVRSWYPLLTSMFMHGSWLHIIGNMWFLWVFGNNVEDAMGRTRFVIFYLLCGLAAAASQTLASPASPIPMVGASGAIGGVMGAYIVLYPRVRVHMLIFLGFYVTTIAVPAFFMLAYWFLVQLLSGLPAFGGGGSGVAFWAHVGGFLTGALMILLFRDRRLIEAQRRLRLGWPNA